MCLFSNPTRVGSKSTGMAEFIYPTKPLSVRCRRRKSTPWGLPVEELLSSEKDLQRYGNGHNVSSENLKSSQGFNTPSRPSKRIRRSRENGGEAAERLAVKTDIAGSIVYPKLRGVRSPRPRGKIPASWVSPADGFQNFEPELSKHGNALTVDSKKRRFSATFCNASERGKENSGAHNHLMKQTNVAIIAASFEAKENNGPDTNKGTGDPVADTSVEISGTDATEQTCMTVPNTSFGIKEKDAGAVELLTVLTIGTKAGGTNDQKVVLKKMKFTQQGTASCNASNYVAKVQENSGADIEHSTMFDTSAEVKDSAGGADANNRTCAPVAETLLDDVKGSNPEDTNVAERMRVLMVDATAELSVNDGPGANFVACASVSTIGTLANLQVCNGSTANTLERTTVRTTAALAPRQGEANDSEFGPKRSSSLNLGIGNEHPFNLSSAESALASLYGESERASCIEFAVKLLMNEIPLPKEAEGVEEFFSQNMNSQKSYGRMNK